MAPASICSVTAIPTGMEGQSWDVLLSSATGDDWSRVLSGAALAVGINKSHRIAFTLNSGWSLTHLDVLLRLG